MPNRKFALRILGQDDWLIYARRQGRPEGDGTLVYTVIETDWHWLETPNGGEARYGSAAWRIDNLWMQFYVERHVAEYCWRECDYDTDGTYLGWPPDKDAEFIRCSNRTYLPEPDDALST